MILALGVVDLTQVEMCQSLKRDISKVRGKRQGMLAGSEGSPRLP